MSEDADDERRFGNDPDARQGRLPLPRPGVDTVIWHLPTGTLLIETRAGVTYVNGSPVEPLEVTLERIRRRGPRP